MENAVTAVIGLFFMLRSKQYSLDQPRCVRTDAGSPATVIVTIFGIDLFVIKMLRLHVFRIGDVFRKILIGSPVRADQPVVLVTNADLTHCGLQNCGLVVMRVQY